MRWEKLPLRAQVSRRRERGVRRHPIGLRVQRSEMLGLLAALRSRLSVAPDQSQAAGGTRQDQSGKCEWRFPLSEGVSLFRGAQRESDGIRRHVRPPLIPAQPSDFTDPVRD